MKSVIKLSCILAAAPLLQVLGPLQSALADGITIKQKSRGCNEGSPNRCVLGAQLTRRNRPVRGQVLQLLRSTDGGESFSRFGNSGRKTDQQGQVIFRFAAPDEETCYEVRTGPNGNARRDYHSRILCIGDSSNNGEDQSNNNNSDDDNNNSGSQDSVNGDNNNSNTTGDNNNNGNNDDNDENDQNSNAAEDSFNGGIDDIEQEADGDDDQQGSNNSVTNSVNEK